MEHGEIQTSVSGLEPVIIRSRLTTIMVVDTVTEVDIAHAVAVITTIVVRVTITIVTITMEGTTATNSHQKPVF